MIFFFRLFSFAFDFSIIHFPLHPGPQRQRKPTPLYHQFHLLSRRNQRLSGCFATEDWMKLTLKQRSLWCAKIKTLTASAFRDERHFPLSCAGSVSLDLIQYAKSLREMCRSAECETLMWHRMKRIIIKRAIQSKWSSVCTDLLYHSYFWKICIRGVPFFSCQC